MNSNVAVCTCEWSHWSTSDRMHEGSKISKWDPECMAHSRATVILFKSGGKYYTEETWTIPSDAIGPYDMVRSIDWRSGWHVLVVTQEPWGYPHLIPEEKS